MVELNFKQFYNGKLHISLIFSNLEVKTKTLNYISLMHNFIAKFYKILDVCNYASVMNIKEFYEDNIGKSFIPVAMSRSSVRSLSISIISS